MCCCLWKAALPILLKLMKSISYFAELNQILNFIKHIHETQDALLVLLVGEKLHDLPPVEKTIEDN